ncbi:MAG: ketopantoate reductase family protein [Rhodospirillales bacterium]|jgi:2-dehydropantoate 2-reductase
MPISDKKIAVLGAGSTGGCVGADLAEAGLDVTIIDQWPAHVDTMKENGLHIQFPEEDLKVPVTAWHLCELAEHVPEFDVIFLSVKSNDTRWCTGLIEPYLKEDGVFVGLQNGMNNDTIADIVGKERTLGAVVELSGEIFTPGIIQRDTTHTGTWFGLGELDGTITPRLKEVQSIMENVAKIGLTQNVEGAKWTKLIANTMVMGMVGFLGLKTWEAAKLPGMSELAVQAGRESVAVGKALGYEMEPVFGLSAEEFSGATDDVLLKAMETLLGHIGKNATTAAIHDHIKGRKSEMEYITGIVDRKGEEFGISTPVNTATTEIDRRINEGEIEMDVTNFGLLKSMLDSLPNRV